MRVQSYTFIATYASLRAENLRQALLNEHLAYLEEVSYLTCVRGIFLVQIDDIKVAHHHSGEFLAQW